MSDKLHGRKEFLKKLSKVIPGALAEASGIAAYANDDDLIDEQKEFLTDYTVWLAEFQTYVAKRNENPLNIENNKKLMDLTAQQNDKKTTLEMYMKDPKFSKYFNEITREITEAI